MTITENSRVNPVGYDRNTLSAGILHFGVGNFHRAHMEYYTDKLIEKLPSQANWAIVGAMILPSDERIFHALDQQKGLYTLTACGCDGEKKAQLIGSLASVIWGVESPQEIIELIADKRVKIISLTITEGGYNIDKASGQFVLSAPGVKHDLDNPQNPTTAFGYIAQGLRQRIQNGAGPITILSCDNLQHNGDTARKAFTSFFQAQDPMLNAWAKDNVTFPNSMVDRITPATLPADIDRLNALNGTDDKAPVYCEDYIQWVIEDKFAAGRPQWECAGVEFTDDVTAYENMKLSLLNASHTLLSYPAFLAGYRKVDIAMADERILKLVNDFMDKDITPFVPAPRNIDLSLYKRTLTQRFANPAVSDQIARLCADGISKFPVYVMPNLAKMIAQGKDLTRLALLVAAYRHYLKYRVDDQGATFTISEPWLTASDQSCIASADPIEFLSLSAFSSVDLASSHPFVTLYLRFCQEIKSNGILPTLSSL